MNIFQDNLPAPAEIPQGIKKKESKERREGRKFYLKVIPKVSSSSSFLLSLVSCLGAHRGPAAALCLKL